jgi:hypothetical protein
VGSGLRTDYISGVSGFDDGVVDGSCGVGGVQVGFDRVRAWDATPFFKDNPLIRPGCRTVYLARKASA